MGNPRLARHTRRRCGSEEGSEGERSESPTLLSPPVGPSSPPLPRVPFTVGNLVPTPGSGPFRWSLPPLVLRRRTTSRVVEIGTVGSDPVPGTRLQFLGSSSPPPVDPSRRNEPDPFEMEETHGGGLSTHWAPWSLGAEPHQVTSGTRSRWGSGMYPGWERALEDLSLVFL